MIKRIIAFGFIVCFLGATGFSQNFGIGQPNPSEKLDVNGNIKANSVVFSDGTSQSRAPRVIYTQDTRSGCPPSWAANTDLIAQTFSLSATASVSVKAAIIRNAAGRHDLHLYVDGSLVDHHLNYTSSGQWEDAYVQWAGTLGAGNHTVSIRSPSASVYGCGPDWGSMQTIIFE